MYYNDRMIKVWRVGGITHRYNDYDVKELSGFKRGRFVPYIIFISHIGLDINDEQAFLMKRLT